VHAGLRAMASLNEHLDQHQVLAGLQVPAGGLVLS
jgi:hypothetical protein